MKNGGHCHVALFFPSPGCLGLPYQLLNSLGSQSPVAFPKLAQQHVLIGASSVLAPVGFLSAKLLAQLSCCLFPYSSAWNFHSQSSIELHPFF